MADIIQLLPDAVANRIAAGEVVSRPAAAVKELMENAIDAGATFITLVVKEGGKGLMQVIDNGHGMSENDARMCFERHATSKIKDPDDLFRIKTKGFRGEALASIAAIAKVELKTRQPSAETGTCVKVEGSEFISSEACATPQGTVISIKNLFFNVPARRKFLKSDPVETKHIMEEFVRVALAHPEIGFEMLNNGQQVYRLETGSLRKRIVGILGSNHNDKLVPVDEKTDVVTVTGFIVKPEFSKKTRGDQYFFANHRFIKSGYMNHAVEAAFEGLLPKDCHPGYFLFLDLNPEEIDINIHPQKTEVKFSDERSIYHILSSAVKQGLGKYNISPSLDFDRETSFDFSPVKDISTLKMPEIQVNQSYNPFEEEIKKSNSRGGGYAPPEKTERERNNLNNWQNIYTDFDTFEPNNQTFANIVPSAQNESLFDEHEVNTDDYLRSSYFQLEGKYLVTSIKSGLVVIDQHRAHERVLYERLVHNAERGHPAIQQSLFPETIEFNPIDFQLLKEVWDELLSIGFDMEIFGANAIIVRGLPADLPEKNVQKLIEELLDQFKHNASDLKMDKNNTVLKALADKMAVRYGTKLSKAEAETLIADLFSCAHPFTAPNGKPTILTMNLTELDEKFLR
jgi:DNA mismatch repair protein MutL